MAAVRGGADRDGVPGSDVLAQPGALHRPPDRRGDPGPRGRLQDAGASPCDRAARRRRHRRARAPLRQLSAPALRRDASARDDRDGDLREPGRPDRRRADDRARRDDAGANRRSARPAGRRTRHGGDPDHTRPRARRDDLRHDQRHVRRSDRRAQRGRAALLQPGASVQRGPARRDLPPRRGRRAADRRDRRSAAPPAAAPAGLLLSSALPVRDSTCATPRRRGLHELTDDRQARCHLAEQRAGLVAA